MRTFLGNPKSRKSKEEDALSPISHFLLTISSVPVDWGENMPELQIWEISGLPPVDCHALVSLILNLKDFQLIGRIFRKKDLANGIRKRSRSQPPVFCQELQPGVAKRFAYPGVFTGGAAVGPHAS